MKRDKKLIRLILLEVEKKSGKKPEQVIIGGYELPEMNYNIELLSQAGIFDMQNLAREDDPVFGPGDMTWEGHEFLDKIRDNKKWM